MPASADEGSSTYFRGLVKIEEQLALLVIPVLKNRNWRLSRAWMFSFLPHLEKCLRYLFPAGV